MMVRNEWERGFAHAFAVDGDEEPLAAVDYTPVPGGIAEAFEQVIRADQQARAAAAAEAAAIAAVRSAIAPCEIRFDDAEKGEGEGFLYILRFSTGAIKVGQTVDLQKRLSDHRRDAAAFNVVITDYWFSRAHLEYLANEQKLISFCAGIARRVKSEYFHGTDLVTVREFAASLVNLKEAF